MARRHHSYYSETAKVQEYIKNPIETRYFIAENGLDAEGYNIQSKDWDTGSMDDFYIGAGGVNKGTYHIRKIGEYEFTLENWKMRYRDLGMSGGNNYYQYLLRQETVDAANLGVAKEVVELRDGCYMYADQMGQCNYPTTKYLHNIGVYPDRIIGESTKNVFHKESYLHLNVNVETKEYYTDYNVVSFLCEFFSSRRMTLSFDRKPEFIVKWVYDWNVPEDGRITDFQPIEMEFYECENGRWRGDTIGYGDYVGRALVVFGEGITYEQLRDMGCMIEHYVNENPVYVPAKIDHKIEGWRLPTTAEWAQLFAMSGDLDFSNVIKWLFSSANDMELPYTGANFGQDLLGARITASGHRKNELNGAFYDYGQSAYFATYFDATLGCDKFNAPTISIRRNGDGYGNNILCDDGMESMPVQGSSTRYWLRSVRFCRPLTDVELGYKLFVNESKNTIDIIEHTLHSPAIHPTDAPELEKGIIRGLALRYMSEDRRKIMQPLSFFKNELAKTRNNGGYGWWNFEHIT